MKKTILYGITAVAMMFASCTKDLTNDFTTENGIQRGELITVNVEKEATRLSADEEGVLTWNDGDQIAVILTDGTNYSIDTETYKMTIKNGKTTVEIPDNTAYAIYPAQRGCSYPISSLDLHSGYSGADFQLQPYEGIIYF